MKAHRQLVTETNVVSGKYQMRPQMRGDQMRGKGMKGMKGVQRRGAQMRG